MLRFSKKSFLRLFLHFSAFDCNSFIVSYPIKTSKDETKYGNTPTNQLYE